MSNAAEFSPEQDVAQERFTTRKLLGELRELAGRNGSFRRGQIDRTGFTTTEGEIVEDTDEPEARVELEYEFSATRYRHRDRPAVTEYLFAAVATKEFIELPAPIAVREFDLPPDEAIKAAGACTLKQALRFSVSNRSRALKSCESFACIDEFGDVISYACNCDDCESESFVDTSEESDSEDGDGVIPDRLIHVPVHERVKIMDIDEALLIWSGLESLGPNPRKKLEITYDLNLKLAFATLRRAKQSLLEQAGVVSLSKGY